MKIYHHQTEFKVKQDGSPVTKADLIAERILLSALKRLKNDVPIVSEENTQSHAMKTPESFFLVDPLDGTKEFLKADGSSSDIDLQTSGAISDILSNLHIPFTKADGSDVTTLVVA